MLITIKNGSKLTTGGISEHIRWVNNNMATISDDFYVLSKELEGSTSSLFDTGDEMAFLIINVGRNRLNWNTIHQDAAFPNSDSSVSGGSDISPVMRLDVFTNLRHEGNTEVSWEQNRGYQIACSNIFSQNRNGLLSRTVLDQDVLAVGGGFSVKVVSNVVKRAYKWSFYGARS